MEREAAVFGCTIKELEEAYSSSSSKQIFLMGILSDAQEALSFEDAETARKYMNRAKYIISKMPKSTFEEK